MVKSHRRKCDRKIWLTAAHFLDRRLAGCRGDFRDQGMIGRQHAKRGAEQCVGPRREHFEGRLGGVAVDGEADVGTHALADPVALHFLETVGPVEQVQIFE